MTGFPKWWWWLFKISFPVTLILYPVVALFGSYSVWPPAQDVLTKYSNDVPILIGFSERTTYSNSETSHYASRSYVLFPSILHNPIAVTVEKTDESVPVVTESVTPVIFMVVYFIASIIGTWWFWLRRKVTQQVAPGDAKKRRT